MRRADTTTVKRYLKGPTLFSESVPSFTAGVNRVHIHHDCHTLMRAGVDGLVTQSSKPIRVQWGPPRRDAPRGAHSTPAPATRDGVTARPIQPVDVRACPSWHNGQAGRWHGPCAPDRERRGRARRGVGCCARRYRVPVGTPNLPHPLRGSCTEHDRSTPIDGILPRRTGRTHAPFCRVRWPGRPRAYGWGNLGVHAGMDVIRQPPRPTASNRPRRAAIGCRCPHSASR